MRTISIVAALAVAIMLWVAPGVEAFLRLHLGGLPASGQTSGCPVGMTCVTPTGIYATDTANIQAAVSSDYASVLLLPGTFKTNADIVITNRNVSLRGYGNAATWGAGLGGSNSPYPSNTNVDCSAIPHTSGDLGGCFVLKNQNAHLSGFRIFANSGSGENCIAIGDAGTVIDGSMILDYCYVGVIVDTAVGTTTGYALNTFINHTYMAYPWQFAIYCNSSCTDFMFGPNIWTEVAGGKCAAVSIANCTGLVPGAHAAVYMGPNSIHGRVVGNFFGDGAYCLWDSHGSDIAFQDNECGNSFLALLDTVNRLQITGNSGYVNFTGYSAFYIYGSNNAVQITDNYFQYNYSSCFTADSASSAGFVGTTTIANNHCNMALYADAYSEAAYDAYVNPHPYGGATMGNSSLTLAAPDWQYGFDVTLPLQHGANTLTNPVYTAFGQKGTFSIQQSPVGGDTISTGTAYLNSPASLSTTAYATDIYPWLTNSQGSIIFGAKLASLTPNANLLTGGNNMATGWTPSGYNATGGWTPNSVADPVGTSTAAKYIEDNTGTSEKHSVGQSVSLSPNTVYTCSVWFSQGTSGNRNVVIQVYDASFSNGFWVFFNGANGTKLGASGIGLQGSGNAGVQPGYIRPYVTFSLPTAPANLYFLLSIGTALSYIGDGSSNGYYWGPTCRLGTSP